MLARKGSLSLVLDCRAFGGQAGASARIENYLGFPTGISGLALMARAYNQVALADGGDRPRLRLPGELAEGAHLMLLVRRYRRRPHRRGILIYTATAGAQGTLGGLVGTAPRFAYILRNALERATICSNDPVCADHEPDDRSGDRADTWRGMPRLFADRRDELRNAEFVSRSQLIGSHDGHGWCGIFRRVCASRALAPSVPDMCRARSWSCTCCKEGQKVEGVSWKH